MLTQDKWATEYIIHLVWVVKKTNALSSPESTLESTLTQSSD